MLKKNIGASMIPAGKDGSEFQRVRDDIKNAIEQFKYRT
ncbi:hypothetical protein ACUW9X_001731 [Staphylococcus hominis]|nr:arsenate reductase, thioredoxin type domain protein [Staphylococcus hominis VCU122]